MDSNLRNTNWILKYQGAESKIWFGTAFNTKLIKKERFIKTYRVTDLDEKLTKERTRAEIRAIIKLKNDCEELKNLLPTIYFTSEREIIMDELVNCKTINDFIKNKTFEKSRWLYEYLGKTISLIHKNEIVHGDITTSNFLISDKNQIIPIDFGLSQFNSSIEDLAVDLYVLERSLLTSDIEHYQGLNIILDSYKKEMGKKGFKIIEKLEEVRLRGRKRSMIG